MKIGFVVNDVETEEAAYTTTRLAMAAVNWATRATRSASAISSTPPMARSTPTPAPPTARTTSRSKSSSKSCSPTTTSPSTICLDELDVLLLAQRPVDRRHRAPLGPVGRHPVRPARRQPRRDGAQRPGESGPRTQQNLLPAVSRGGPAENVHQPQRRRDQAIHRRAARQGRDQAAARLRRQERVPRRARTSGPTSTR